MSGKVQEPTLMKIVIPETTARPAFAPGRIDFRAASAALLLAGITLALYWPSRGFQFINYDDFQYIVTNPNVRSGLTWPGVEWAFTSGYAANWHPLTWLSHMLDVSCFGLSPGGPHVINALLHAANASLLFLLLRDLTGRPMRSLFVAGVFALHPLRVESVAWIAERKDLLSALFGLLTLWSYGRQVRSGAFSTGRFGPWSGFTLVLFGLGLMSKPMLVTLPFVFLLLDHWPLGRIPRAWSLADLRPLVVEKAPFFALSFLCCLITYFVQRSGGAVQSLTDLSLVDRCGNAFVAYARYLGKLLWPMDLLMPYPHPGHWPRVTVISAVVLMIALCAGAWRAGCRWPVARTGWFWFVGMLVPVIGLVQVGDQSLADRYTYLPLIGPVLVLVWAAGAIGDRLRLPQRPAAAAALILLVSLAGLTGLQLRHWRNSETLARHALAANPENWMAHFSLARHLGATGRIQEALDHYRSALALRPGSAEVLSAFGNALAEQEQYAQSIPYLEKALRLKPDFAEAHSNLGSALANSGGAGAAEHLIEALRLVPSDALSHYRLGNYWVRVGKPAEALGEYRLAVKFNAGFAEAWNNLGVMLFNQGRTDESIASFQEVLRADPDYKGAHFNLANALAHRGEWERAAVEYAGELRAAPGLAEAHFGLGRALLHLGRRADSVKELKETLRLNAEHAAAADLLRSIDSGAPR